MKRSLLNVRQIPLSSSRRNRIDVSEDLGNENMDSVDELFGLFGASILRSTRLAVQVENLMDEGEVEAENFHKAGAWALLLYFFGF